MSKVTTVQNKGVGAKQMRGSHREGTHGIEPGTGTAAVEMKGSYVHARHIEGVTRAASGNKGSHDHLAREHADHSMGKK